MAIDPINGEVLGDVLGDIVSILRSAGCVFAEDEAALLTEAASDEAVLAALVARRVAGEPLEYLVGFVEFCDSRYALRAGVFISRQRSSLLVMEAVRLGGGLLLDLCCGCGALGLAVHRRLDCELVATDISADAVACARQNGIATTYIGDLFEALPPQLGGRIDLLIANAPYVPSAAVGEMPRESRDYEPRSTVDGGSDGMDLQRRVLAGAADWLAPGGHLLTETSRDQAGSLTETATNAGFHAWIVDDHDLAATVLVARLPS